MVKFQDTELMGFWETVETTEWEGNKLGITMNKHKIEWFTWEILLSATGIN